MTRAGDRPDGVTTYGLQIQPRMGFFTDTSICIGCKACEVACKEWNLVPDKGFDLTGNSYDNTGELSADSWRHVAFVEQQRELSVNVQDPGLDTAGRGGMDFRWLMSSDVCKHCTHAGCLDVCPTGAIFRTEYGTVVIQDDVCNGCGYCVTACPFGVISKRERDGDGGMHKCTLCYDRLKDDLEPACAKACPTKSIQFGPLDELLERAHGRLDEVKEAGVEDARLYLAGPDDGIGGAGAFFLLLDEPEVYGLPHDPVVPTARLRTIWGAAFLAGAALAAAVAGAFLGGPE